MESNSIVLTNIQADWVQMTLQLMSKCTSYYINVDSFYEAHFLPLCLFSLALNNIACVKLHGTTGNSKGRISQSDLFGSQKFQKVCVLKFVVSLNWESSISQLSNHQSLRDKVLVRFPENDSEMFSNLIISYVLSFSSNCFQARHHNSVYLVNSDFQHTKLIFVETCSDSIYMGCFTCSKSFHINYWAFSVVQLITLKQIPSKTKSIAIKFDDNWKQLNGKLLNNFGIPANLYGSMYFSEAEKLQPKFESLKVLFLHLNCSISLCSEVFLNSKFKGILEFPLSDFNNDLLPAQFSVVGSDQNQFCVIVVLPRGKHVTRIDLSPWTFVSPFVFHVWIVFVLVVFQLTITVSFLSNTELPLILRILKYLFTLYSSPLGQGVNLNKLVSKINTLVLITIWLFASFVLRAYYSEDIYKVLSTRSLDPALPNNFDDLSKQNYSIYYDSKWFNGYKMKKCGPNSTFLSCTLGIKNTSNAHKAIY